MLDGYLRQLRQLSLYRVKHRVAPVMQPRRVDVIQRTCTRLDIADSLRAAPVVSWGADHTDACRSRLAETRMLSGDAALV